jgi:hypothetical protein
LPKAENRNVAVAEASRALKLVARELEVPVVALSQLSRATEQRGGDKKPMLSDLHDSGALEQDADLVVFIHRPEVYDPRPEVAGLADIIVAKHRNGKSGASGSPMADFTNPFSSSRPRHRYAWLTGMGRLSATSRNSCTAAPYASSPREATAIRQYSSNCPSGGLPLLWV